MADPSDLERFDPKQLIRQALELEDPSATTPRDCILLWLLSLPEEVDPAEAAMVLLEMVFGRPGDGANPLREGLALELAEVSRHPRTSLLARGPRRRRSARRS